MTETKTAAADAGGNALVVFHGHGSGHFARWFGAPGFRHCFVCLTSGGYWTRLDFKIGVPEFEVLCADSFDLEGFYRNAGFAVAPASRAAGPAASANTIWPLMMANCVGAVKKVLGLHSPWVQTPKQLYRYLKEQTHETT